MFLTHSWYNFELNEPSCVIYVHLLSLKNLHMLFCYGHFVISYLFGFCRFAELIYNEMSGSSEIILYYSEMQLELSEIDLNYLKLIWKLLKLTWMIWNSLGNFWNSLEKGVVIRHKIYILYISSELIQLDHLEYFIIPIRSYGTRFRKLLYCNYAYEKRSTLCPTIQSKFVHFFFSGQCSEFFPYKVPFIDVGRF